MTTVVDSLNAGLRHCMENSERVYLLGEDILDPYGGAFKVTKGLSTEFSERVLTTPVSEAGIVGIAIGMAMRGFAPVVEIMFGDFLTLATDQILNHAAKFRWISGGVVTVPIVIRTPMGGRRGYGPTHSQTLEKHFLGIPGLRTLAVNTLADPGEVLTTAVQSDPEPVLLIENKVLYARELYDPSAQIDFSVSANGGKYPEHLVTIDGAPRTHITTVAYGQMAEIALEAMRLLAYEHEIFLELIVPTQISPFKTGTILTSTLASRKLLILEEGTETMGYGAEVIARVSASTDERIKYSRVAAMDVPVPSAGVLEEHALPQVSDVVEAALELERDN